MNTQNKNHHATPESKRMDKLKTLLQLIDVLYNAGMVGITRDEIKGKIKCETRTFERMMNVIKEYFGNSLQYDYYVTESKKRYKKYRLESSKLPPNPVTYAELSRLKTTAEFLRTKHPEMAHNLDSVVGKLSHISTITEDANDLFYSSGMVSVPQPIIERDAETIRIIQQAILSYRRLSFIYRGKTRHHVLPLGLLYGTNKLFLVAWHERHLKSPPVQYNCDYIEGVKILKKSFNAKNFDMHKYIEKSFGIYKSAHGPYDVEWRVLPIDNAVSEAEKYIFHPTQEKIKNKDGSLTIRFHADGLHEMAYHLFTWENKIIPVAPKELVTEYKKMLSQALDALNNPSTDI